MQETWVQSLSRENPLEKEMATHSSILALEISWTEELGGPRSTGLQRGRCDLEIKQQLQFSLVQSLSHVRLFATPWTAACQAFLGVHHQLPEFTQTHVH